VKYFVMYVGSILIGVIGSIAKFGWFVDGKWFWPGAIVCSIATLVWMGLVHLITKDKES